jgi:glycosyltransferase involved in cell wall biosynthesis
MNDYKFSVIIPAYNEEKLISQTLNYLLADDYLSNIEILVVCNGCYDKTYENVNRYIEENQSSLNEKSITLLVTLIEEASKTNAINIGVIQTVAEIKILLDADIEMTGQGIETLVDELIERKLKGLTPKVTFSYQYSSFFVRQYYNIASQSFYNTKYRLSNVIALSPEGVSTLGTLPKIIADDEYIRRLFSDSEVSISDNCAYTFICSKTLGSLLQVLTRVERGNIQLTQFSHKFKVTCKVKGYRSFSILSFPFFMIIKFLIKIRAKFQLARGNIFQWERDESNRTIK